MTSKNLYSLKRERKETKRVVKAVRTNPKSRKFQFYVGAYIPLPLYQAVKRVAKTEDRTVAYLLRRAMKQVVSCKILSDRVGDYKSRAPRPKPARLTRAQRRKAVAGVAHRAALRGILSPITNLR